MVFQMERLVVLQCFISVLIFYISIPHTLARNNSELAHSCSNNCSMLTNGSYLVAGGNYSGAPEFRSSVSYKDITPGQHVVISCLLCQSRHHATTLTWYFNGTPLINKEHQIRIRYLCGEKLLVKVRNNNDVGSYTCVARNSQGTSNRTTIIRSHVIENMESTAKGTIAVEGMVVGNEARAGSIINITCAMNRTSNSPVKWSWKLNKKLINISQSYKIDQDNRTSQLRINNLTSEDTGIYECFATSRLNPKEIFLKMSSSLNVVECFQGFYCPSSSAFAIRCPFKTFSWFKNATSITDCTKCPTFRRNETIIILASTQMNTVKLFKENCPVTPIPESSKKYSTMTLGVQLAIVVSSLIISAIIIIVIISSVKLWRRRKTSLLFRPSTLKEIESPLVPVINDVYVCYSSKNKSWVYDTLFENLKKANITAIDHFDFDAGLVIWQNIINSIYSSRKVLFILSKDALKSFYTRCELRQAVARKTKARQVIVVLYDKVEKLPVEIKNKVYLDWTDKENREEFWRKLYAVLKKPTPAENDGLI